MNIPPAIFDMHPHKTSKLQPNLSGTLHIQQPSNSRQQSEQFKLTYTLTDI